MKKIFPIFFLPILIACSNKTVSISGELSGMSIGDTLCFTTSIPPFFENEHTDTIIATGEDFAFEIPATHTIVGYLTHHHDGHSSGPYDIIARPGDHLNISGQIETLGGAHISGGLYNLPDVNRLCSLGAPIDSTKSLYSRKLTLFSIENKTDSIAKYSSLYNKIDYPDEYKALWQTMRDSADHEYAAYMCMKRIYKYTADELDERVKRFSVATQQCYMVNELRQIVSILRNIDVGNSLPDYTLIDNTEKSHSLYQYRDKYLLLYYYGLCPGVIFYSESKIEKLYNKYHDKGLEIIGICRDGDINARYPQLISKDKDIRSLVTHPYATVYATDDRNKYLQRELFLIVTPTMILIAPDGKTLARGNNNVHKKIDKILQEALIEKGENL
ncbi:MAG: redoxin family protein [Coprobacter sp.]|nr:redoxin family protein [Coprobacter sp.]